LSTSIASRAVLGGSNRLESLWVQRDDNRDGFVSIEEYRDPL